VLQFEGLRAISFGDAGVADQHGSQTKVRTPGIKGATDRPVAPD
jgi:hypothetical protein